MKIRLSELRALIREAVADTMMAPTSAPPPSMQQLQNVDHPALNPKTPGATKANQVAKIVNQMMGNTNMTQAVQKYVASLDPQDQLVLPAEEIAKQFVASRQQS